MTLRAALAKLPDEQRQALELARKGQGYSDIASAMGLTYAEIKTLTHAAMLALRTTMLPEQRRGLTRRESRPEH